MVNTAIPSLNGSINSYFDLEAALERCCDDAEFLAEMIDLLGSSVTPQCEAIAEAIRQRDPKALAESAHSLKGTVASMTTAAPYQLAWELEILGKDGDLIGVDALLAALRVSVDQLLQETRAWVTRRNFTASS